MPGAHVALRTSEIFDGGTMLPVKYATVSCSSSGNNEIVAAVTGKRIRVLQYTLMASGAVNAKWRSASTDITGLKYFAAAGDGVSPAFSPTGHFQTVAGEALNLNLSGAVAVGGEIAYVEPLQ